MGVKHSHSSIFSLSLPNFTPSSIHRCRLSSWINGKISINKHFEDLSELWRLHILQIQSYNRHRSTHVRKETQTLNSILRQCGVSIDLVAAVEIDLLLKYQLLNMTAYSMLYNAGMTCCNPCQIKKSGFPSVHQEGTRGIMRKNSEEKPLVTLTPHGLPNAKSSGHFLVLVPLIAFCITCIVGAIRTRLPKDKGSEALDEGSKSHLCRPKSIRWKHALTDIVEPDILDSESRQDSNSASEDNNENTNEDKSYSKVENDYQKFLSECGISESGYWRGGIGQ